ncbi:MAG: bifunctional oligoribonuclease/PAP phosphatase NrnA [Firmicutes bacterium]|nr:bifunctional oligoribonuclease/PAP phosphatase NrnA [Bacillota bacterium]
MPQTKDVVDAIRQYGDFLLVCHIFPDGDAIGSLLAMRLALMGLGKKVRVACDDDIPDSYTFLPGADQILKPVDINSRPDVVVSLDSSDRERLGKIQDLLAGWNSPVINIDHHVTNDHFGHYNYVLPDAAATGELVYQIVQDLGVDITQDLATCILTAIISDTGSFRYCNTTGRSLSIAARLVDLGASPSHISMFIFETRSYYSVKLLGRVLDKLQTTCERRVAWAEVTRKDLAEFDVAESETEGFINYPRMIKGVECALLFREGKDGKIHVGFRSRDPIDVAAIARHFGGGGHARAAGCIVEGSMDEVRGRVLDLVCRVVASGRSNTDS